MAKGKSASGKNYTSKGQRPNVNKWVRKAVRRDYMASGERMVNQINAWKKGKRVMVTIPNPNPNETNKRFLRVPASEAWALGNR